MKNNPLQDCRVFVRVLDSSQEFDFSDDRCSTRVRAAVDRSLDLDGSASHFIVVHRGDVHVSSAAGTYVLHENCFGSFPGAVRLDGRGSALILSSIGYTSPVLIGGPVEACGRLRYVDGCTASLLLPPPVRGEPCLNFMHLPRQTAQTLHSHPSLRVGLILSGSEKCETEHGALPFCPGTVFIIPPGVLHSFQSEDETLRIVIYHPDSDSGPTHTDHTMLNRTYVEGQSAQSLTNLHTVASEALQ